MTRRLCVRLWVSLAECSLAWLVVQGAIAAPTPSSPQVVINVGAASVSAPSTGALLVTVDELSSNELKDAKLVSAPKDIEQTAASGRVSFGEPIALAPVRAQRRWLLPFKVADLPAGSTQTRYFAFKVGAADWALPYQIASPASAPMSWSIKPPPAANRALESGDGIPISIAVNGSTRITGVQLMPVDLVEQVSRRPLSKVEWRLCPTRVTCKEGDAASLDGGPHSLWIVPVGAASVSPGRYEGTITISSNDKPAGESVALTLNFSSTRDKILGSVAIVVGMAVGLYTTVVLRRRVERDQLLMGPALLRGAVMQLRVMLRAAPSAMTPNIDKRLDTLEKALSVQSLESAGLPSSIPFPWPESTDAYRQYVDRQTAALNTLRTLVETGVVQLLAARHDEEDVDGPLDVDEVASFDEAMRKIDAIAVGNTVIDPSTISATTADAIQAFKEAVGRSRKTSNFRAAFVNGVSPGKDARPPATSEQLRVQIAEGSVLAWIILICVTAITGTYVLVLSNAGFGTCLDYLGCLLWGAGLPAGAALAGATTGTVSSAFNIVR